MALSDVLVLDDARLLGCRRCRTTHAWRVGADLTVGLLRPTPGRRRRD